MKRFTSATFITAAMLSFLALTQPTYSADMPIKAPAKPSLFTGVYPATSGLYFGVGTMGGGGSVNVSVPGVNNASLVTNQISANIIAGYVWGVANTTAFVAVEGWFGVNNINGSAPGIAFTGPATFTQRVMIGVPLSDITALFPTWGLTPPPFPALPNGQTASNVKTYLAAHFSEDDVTLDVIGNGANRDWRFAPGISVGAIGQLTSGSVVDVAAVLKFPQKGLCVGPGTVPGMACGAEGTQLLGLLAVKF